VDLFSLRIFDVDEEQKTNSRIFYKQFDSLTKIFGAEVIFNNLFYKNSDKNFNGLTIWYFNDFEVYRNSFQINVKKDWDSVIFVQTFDKKEINFKKGQAKVEIYVQNFKVGEKYFLINDIEIEEQEEKLTSNSNQLEEETHSKTKTIQQRIVKPLNELLEELNSYNGLASIKEAIKNFISYLEFLKE